MIRAACLLIALCAAGACASAPPIATGTDEIAALRGRWVAAFNARQEEAIAGTYASDAVYIPITGNRIVSALAIRNLYARIWTKFSPHIDLEPHAVERRGELAYESGDYRESVGAAEGALEVVGAYVFIYRAEASGWALVTQVWTEHAPQRGE